MVDQKCIKNVFTEIFAVFEWLLTQNPTNQDPQPS